MNSNWPRSVLLALVAVGCARQPPTKDVALTSPGLATVSSVLPHLLPSVAPPAPLPVPHSPLVTTSAPPTKMRCASDGDCVMDVTGNPYCACCFCPTPYARHRSEPDSSEVFPNAPCVPTCPAEPCEVCPPDSVLERWRAACGEHQCVRVTK
jgi:hypothetical protein